MYQLNNGYDNARTNTIKTVVFAVQELIMKKSVAAILVFALYVLILPLNVGAFDAPHINTAAGYTCATCHTSNLTLGSTGYNNTCLSCHRPGDPGAGGKSITLADASNPFNNHSTNGINKMYQTSHRWDGSDTVPAAGAQSPIQAQMTTSGLLTRTGGQLACVRCHNQHDKGADGKFLRIANDKDQLCLDCHRSRDTQSQAYKGGSHPVAIDYTSKSAANPKLFNNPPLNNNDANPTSDLNARLTISGGQLLCTTCHGVHFSDSRSSTVDGKDAFATISSGDGYLLRTDRFGAKVTAGQPDNVNICTNCHAGKKSHNAAGQNIQCNDCHGSHVEYDPQAQAGDPTNIKLVRRYLQYSSAMGKNKRIVFTPNSNYTATSNLGVCQACHVPPTTGIHTNIQPTECTGCHAHNSNSKLGSFSPKCIECHTDYPAFTVAGGVVDPCVRCAACHPVLGGSHAVHVGDLMSKVGAYDAVDPNFNKNNSNESSYRFGCAACHPTVNENHKNGNILLAGNGYDGLTKSNITCATSACHADGNGNYATSPNWYTGFTGPDKCAMCHAATPTSGSHGVHAVNGVHDGSGSITYGPDYTCIKCHASTVTVVNGSKVINHANHVNGAKDVRFAGQVTSKAQISPASFGAYSTIWTRSNGYKVDDNSVDVTKEFSAGSYVSGTCSTIACHNNGTPATWGGGKLSCVDCHSQL